MRKMMQMAGKMQNPVAMTRKLRQLQKQGGLNR